MSVILNALHQLNSSLDNLDAAIDLTLSSSTSNDKIQEQTDMFAQKLDNTIKQVEIVLSEDA